MTYEKISRNARDQAKSLGHDMSRFGALSCVIGGRTSTCRKCGMIIRISTLNKVSGDAISVRCGN